MLPIINKLIDDDFVGKNEKEIEALLQEYAKEQEDININFGEV